MSLGFFTVLRAQYKNLPISLKKEDCAGKTYVVTGSNTGLGFECVKHLAAMGAGQVIMGVRNTSSGEKAKATIESQTGCAESVLQVWHMDLSKLETVKLFVEKIKGLDRVDGIVENAAVAMGEWVVPNKDDGLEMNVAVNVIGTIYMAVLLIPFLRAMGKQLGAVVPITIIGSIVALSPEAKSCYDKLGSGSILEDVADQTKWEPLFHHFYPFSKFLLYMFLRELTHHVPVSKSGVIVNFVSPGICYTELDRNAHGPVGRQVKMARMIMGRTAEMGSRTLLHGLVAGRESHGKVLSECEIKDYFIPDWMKDEKALTMGNRIWEEVSAKLEQLDPGCMEAVTNC
ncbi:unnamed protein product [Clonostachys rosea]|uniref:Ketoreductase (KR) domain-containing protein n=1 Tax=Bionectria ochroleuca TaxID=29856 RepID=A0ABY6UH54_BIOOC|nr:unnamed protein product [Clonostachys rosea]